MKCTKANLLKLLHECNHGYIELMEMYDYNGDKVEKARAAGKAMICNEVALMLENNDFFDKIYNLWVEEDC